MIFGVLEPPLTPFTRIITRNNVKKFKLNGIETIDGILWFGLDTRFTVCLCLTRRFSLASFGQPSAAGYRHCMLPAVPEPHGRALDNLDPFSSVYICYLLLFLG